MSQRQEEEESILVRPHLARTLATALSIDRAPKNPLQATGLHDVESGKCCLNFSSHSQYLYLFAPLHETHSIYRAAPSRTHALNITPVAHRIARLETHGYGAIRNCRKSVDL